MAGKGGSSKVFQAQDQMGNMWAVKVIRKDKGYDYDMSWRMLMREHELLQKLSSHPNIINSLGMDLNGSLDCNEKSESIVYNVLEFAKNGVLSYYIRHTGAIEESISKFFALQIWSAIEFIHSQGYCHLDIKLDNILLDEYFNIKMADMGSSIDVSESQGYTDRRRGTYNYMAPEVANLEKGQEFDAYAADIYSLGVTLYIMLTAEFPRKEHIENDFSTSECYNDTNFEQMSNEDWPKTKKWDLLSFNIRQLLKSMMSHDPNSRPSINEVLNHKWLSYDFDHSSPSIVYEEMLWRKEYASQYQLKH